MADQIHLSYIVLLGNLEPVLELFKKSVIQGFGDTSFALVVGCCHIVGSYCWLYCWLRSE